MVLHRGATVKDATGFSFADPARLARWPAPDRGVLVFADVASVETSADRLSDLFRRWLEATA